MSVGKSVFWFWTKRGGEKQRRIWNGARFFCFNEKERLSFWIGGNVLCLWRYKCEPIEWTIQIYSPYILNFSFFWVFYIR